MLVSRHRSAAAALLGAGLLQIAASPCFAGSVPETSLPEAEPTQAVAPSQPQTASYTVAGIPFPVRYAVDERSLSYRTGGQDPAIENVPDEIARLIRSSPENAIGQLAEFLRDGDGSTRGAENDFHLAKRIHDWITLNVAYDTRAAYGFNQETQDPAVFLRYAEGPRAVCRGFADLFLAVAREAGLEAKRISGVCRTYWSNVDRYGTHAWNAVRIDGSWYIIDSSADARVRYGPDGRTQMGSYQDEWLFASPESQLLTYRANDEADQLISEPIDFDAFIAMPMIDAGFLRAGIDVVSADVLATRTIAAVAGSQRTEFFDQYMSTDGTWEMTFSVPADYEIYAYLRDELGADLAFRTITDFSVNPDGSHDATIRCSFPEPGIYELNIRSRRLTELDSFTVYTLRIDAHAGGALLPEIGVFQPTMRADRYGVQHGAVRYAEGRYSFEIAHAPEVEYFVRAESPDGTRIDGRIERSAAGTNTDRYVFSPPAGGLWVIRSYARSAGTSDTIDRTGLLLVESGGAATPGYPLLTARFEPLFHEFDLEVVRDLRLVPGSDRLYSVILRVPEEVETRAYLLECNADREFLRDADGALVFASGHYSQHRDGSEVECFFSPGEARSPDHIYRARFYLRLDGTNRVVLEYFIPAGDGPGDPAP